LGANPHFSFIALIKKVFFDRIPESQQFQRLSMGSDISVAGKAWHAPARRRWRVVQARQCNAHSPAGTIRRAAAISQNVETNPARHLARAQKGRGGYPPGPVNPGSVDP